MPDDPARDRIDEQLNDLFVLVSRMTDDDLTALRATWNGADERARTVAWRNVKRAINLRKRADLLDEARTRMAAWALGQRGGSAMYYGNLMNSLNAFDSQDVHREAFPPLLDAVAATVVSDSLSAEDLQALLEPLNAVTSSRQPS